MHHGVIKAEETRSDPRTHIFLVATLCHGDRAFPVRVRNLSSRGALLEGNTLPEPGATVTLRRGQLEAAGTVVRVDSGKAGLRFEHIVHVHAWLPVKGSVAQRSVDHFAIALEGSKQVGIPACTLDPPARSLADVPAELRQVQLGLIELADKLASDLNLVANHPEVQFLDTAIQTIARIFEALEPEQSIKRVA